MILIGYGTVRHPGGLAHHGTGTPVMVAIAIVVNGIRIVIGRILSTIVIQARFASIPVPAQPRYPQVGGVLPLIMQLLMVVIAIAAHGTPIVILML